MPNVIKTKFSSLTLNTDDIFKEIEKHEMLRRREAAQFTVKVLKKNANKKGESIPHGLPRRRTGNLFRSMGYRLLKDDRSAIVGSKDPKVHLLEFGHGNGKQRNKRPIIKPSFRQAERGIITIMSRPYF